MTKIMPRPSTIASSPHSIKWNEKWRRVSSTCMEISQYDQPPSGSFLSYCLFFGSYEIEDAT